MTPPTVGDAGEHALIARLRARFAPAGDGHGLLLGIGDDAAVIAPERNTFDVVTTDALVEGVHFDRRWMSAVDIGHKAAAVNLSDLGAMGARPRHLLVSLGLPPDLLLADFDALIDGIANCAALHRAVVAGGNITASPGRLFIDITAMGSVKARKILRRSGARAGDEVYVTGQLGGAAAGLALCQAGHGDARDPVRASALARFRHPLPPVAFGGLAGRNRAASACMDLSDGLVDGLSQLSEASGLGVDVRLAAVPRHPAAEDESFRDCQLALLLSGGEDYELLCAVPRRRRRAFLALARQAGVVVTHIGEMHRTPGVRLHHPDGSLVEPPRGFTHFAR
ncbi:MAG: thiamine-phosphate kinase [Acidobacteria bacterium]|nr:thiamine-phosphate kinase [Acidobacteriota bacterium]